MKMKGENRARMQKM